MLPDPDTLSARARASKKPSVPLPYSGSALVDKADLFRPFTARLRRLCSCRPPVLTAFHGIGFTGPHGIALLWPLSSLFLPCFRQPQPVLNGGKRSPSRTAKSSCWFFSSLCQAVAPPVCLWQGLGNFICLLRFVGFCISPLDEV